MTWSICAHDPDSGAFAVAVATCNFAVGASCPHIRAGVGAVSTQSITNRYLGPAVLDAMERGLPAEAALRSALAGDDGRSLRQLHAIDAEGRSAAWTGAHCVEWCGDTGRPGASFAGNMLAGPEVLAATAAAFEAAHGLPLAERMMRAMEAGDAAGGDRRGKQSAALVLTTTEDFPDINIRVDDHKEPIVELRRLFTLWEEMGASRITNAPRKANPAGLIDIDVIEAGWRAKGLDLHFRRPEHPITR